MSEPDRVLAELERIGARLEQIGTAVERVEATLDDVARRRAGAAGGTRSPRDRDREQRELFAAAERFVRATMPELIDEHDRPCGYAIDAALRLKRAGAPFDADAVRRLRERILEHLGIGPGAATA